MASSLITDDFDMSKTQSLGVVGNEALGGEKGMENDDAGKDGETGDESSG